MWRCWCALLLLLCGSAVQANDVLRIRVLGMPPLSFQDASGQWKGLDVELAQVLAAEAGVQLSYQVLPWKRAISMLETGDLDLMPALSMTEERKSFLHFVGVSRDESIVLVVPKDSSYSIQSLDDMKKLKGKVGIRIGSYYGEAFETKMKTDAAFAAKFEARAVSDVNFKKLEADRLDAYFGDLYAMNYRLRNDPEYSDVKLHPFVIYKDVVYFSLSKKSVSPEMVKRLEQAYTRAKAAGKFDAVIKRYK